MVIFQNVNSNGKIELTPEEFKKYISDAYEQGKEDGHVVGYYPITTTTPYYINNGQDIPTHLTCSETTSVATDYD